MHYEYPRACIRHLGYMKVYTTFGVYEGVVWICIQMFVCFRDCKYVFTSLSFFLNSVVVLCNLLTHVLISITVRSV